jgi:hypothetical protein
MATSWYLLRWWCPWHRKINFKTEVPLLATDGNEDPFPCPRAARQLAVVGEHISRLQAQDHKTFDYKTSTQDFTPLQANS